MDTKKSISKKKQREFFIEFLKENNALTQFIVNRVMYRNLLPKQYWHKYKTIPSFNESGIVIAFRWMDTTEGWAFWSRLHYEWKTTHYKYVKQYSESKIHCLMSCK